MISKRFTYGEGIALDCIFAFEVPVERFLLSLCLSGDEPVCCTFLVQAGMNRLCEIVGMSESLRHVQSLLGFSESFHGVFL